MRIAGDTVVSCVVLMCLLASTVASASTSSIAFHYGTRPPVAELSHFEQVVVEPGNVSPEELATLKKSSTVFAYLSIGEVSRSSPEYAAIEPSWILGENKAWNSSVIDPLVEGVRAFLLARAEALWAQGYRGFFLDTLDSPVAVPAPKNMRQARLRALVVLLRAMNQRMPGVKLLLNRGFELFPDVASISHGVVAESLFARWNAAAQRYEPVPEVDRAWLLARLQELHQRYRLPVVVIDYVPPAERERARAVARDILAQGITPYVTNSSLDVLGVGAVEVIPRRVLALYDGAEGPPAASSLHQLLAVPLEALGFTLEYRDVRGALPDEPLTGLYAGVVLWLSDVPLERPQVLRSWLEKQWGDGMRVALLGNLGFAREKAFLARLGLDSVWLEGTPRLGRTDELVGFEASPEIHRRALPDLQAVGSGVRVHLSLVDDSGHEAAAVLTAPWGGLALGPYVLEEGFAGRLRWVLDPFAFLEAALAPEPFPVPDVTTENGRRLQVVHVDGKGFGTPSEPPRALPVGQLLLESLLARSPLAATVSLPPAELRTDQLRQLARRMDRLPYVEVVKSPVVGGGLGKLVLEHSSLTGLSPLLAPPEREGAPPRVYSPLLDARSYEALAWLPYAQSQLIEVFERTEQPRRLEPLALYFPVTACSTSAGLQALQSLKDWILAQPTLPLWLGEYAARARGFASATFSRQLDGSWQVRGLGALRTLRLPSVLGWPDPLRSKGVAGFLDSPRGERYVSLSGSEARLVLTGRPPAGPVLAWANAPILSWRSSSTLSLRLRGHRPVSLALAGVPAGCRLVSPFSSLPGVLEGGVLVFHFSQRDTGDARLVCP